MLRNHAIAASLFAIFAVAACDAGAPDTTTTSDAPLAAAKADQPDGVGKVCTYIAKCAAGYNWDDKSCRCKKVPNGGKQCGSAVCGAQEDCCNASCGICVPKGGFCTQQACAPAPTGCPDGSQPVLCFADPCQVSSCDVVGAQCVSDYCGGCNATWYDTDGNVVCQ